MTDKAARAAAYLTLAEVCFILGLGNTRLAPELGRPDLFSEAYRAAVSARRIGLAAIMDVIGRVHRAVAENRLPVLVDLAQALPRHKDEIEPGSRWNWVSGPKPGSKSWNRHSSTATIRNCGRRLSTCDVCLRQPLIDGRLHPCWHRHSSYALALIIPRYVTRQTQSDNPGNPARLRAATRRTRRASDARSTDSRGSLGHCGSDEKKAFRNDAEVQHARLYGLRRVTRPRGKGTIKRGYGHGNSRLVSMPGR